jgi:hypothetical protein
MINCRQKYEDSVDANLDFFTSIPCEIESRVVISSSAHNDNKAKVNRGAHYTN